MIDIQRTRLDNGLTLLVNENPRLPICTVMVWVRVGSRHERPGLTGMSHYLEHCYSMGTSRFKPRENSAIIQKLGGTKNAFTSKDFTAYYSNVPSEHLALILDMEADRLKNLALPEASVTSEKEVIKEEKRLRYEDAPFGKMVETLYELAYERHPYRHLVIGRWEDLERMSRDDMETFYRRHYVPGNIVLVVTGDVRFGETRKIVQDYFGGMPASSPPPEDTAAEPVQRSERRLVIRKESELSAVLTGYPAVGIDHDDFIPLTFLAMILSSGRSARFFRTLVFEKQLVTWASAMFETARDPALFQIMAQVQPGHTEAEVEAAIEAIVDEIRRTGVGAEEFERIQNQFEADAIFELETNLQRAEMMGRYEVLSSRYGAEFVTTSLDLICKTTREDVQRAARKYLLPERKNVVELDPIKRNGGRS